MKLKLDAESKVVVVDGKPVYVHDDGKEIPFDAAAAVNKISALNGESMGHRQRAEQAEAKFKPYEGLDSGFDIEAAKKALDTVKNFDAGKLIDAGKVQTRIDEAVNTVKQTYKPLEEQNAKLKTQLNENIIGSGFANSKYITDKIAVPRDMIRATFGKYFEVVDGKLVAKDGNGKEIYSRSNPGSLASFDEAMENLVDSYENKAAILKGTGQSGNGINPSNNGNANLNNGNLSGLSPVARLTAARGGAT